MSPALLLASVALAGWTESGKEHGCVFYKGSAEGEVVPLRAECDWPLDARRVQDLLQVVGDHDLYFSAVEESTVLGPAPGGGELVYQVHQAAGISDREVVLVMKDEDIPGGRRFTWERAADQSRITGRLVHVPMDTGRWEVTGGPAGCHVVYELRYLAGGSVPGFVVRWFQGSGMQDLVGELRSYAASH